VTDFYIGFRFHGYPKRYLKGLIHEVSRKFRVKRAIKERPVPHMTLYGDSQTTNMSKVFDAIERVGKRYTLVPFAVKDFDWRHGREGKVIAASIVASPELKNLREELARELSKISTPGPWDTMADFWFHTTIAFKDIDDQFNQIWHYLMKKEVPHINQHLLRITVLNKDRKILREYDLMLKRWLDRRQALSGYWRKKTINKLRELQGLPPERQPSLLDWLGKIFRQH